MAQVYLAIRAALRPVGFLTHCSHPSAEPIPFLQQLHTKSWEGLLPRGTQPLSCHASAPLSRREKPLKAPSQTLKPQPAPNHFHLLVWSPASVQLQHGEKQWLERRKKMGRSTCFRATPQPQGNCCCCVEWKTRSGGGELRARFPGLYTSN